MSCEKIKTNSSAEKRAVVALLFLLSSAFPAIGEDFRNISVVNLDNYFDNSYRITLEDVFLARLASYFTLQTKIARNDTGNFYEHVFSIGPVINFTEDFYLDALYGLGIDSDVKISHQANLNLNYETDTSGIMLGIKGAYFTSDSFYYLLLSGGGWFQPTEWLIVFNKIFLSWDSDDSVSGSYWGELSWIVSAMVIIRTGFTLSYSGDLGYSILGGFNVKFSSNVILKYNFQFFANSIDYLTAPRSQYGIQNGLILDVKF